MAQADDAIIASWKQVIQELRERAIAPTQAVIDRIPTVLAEAEASLGEHNKLVVRDTVRRREFEAYEQAKHRIAAAKLEVEAAATRARQITTAVDALIGEAVAANGAYIETESTAPGLIAANGGWRHPPRIHDRDRNARWHEREPV